MYHANLKGAMHSLVAIAMLFALHGCGSGSGAATVQNPQTTPPVVGNYNGPAPATADVQTFKLSLWDNLVPNNRCGSCHNPSQTPRFVRSDDINLAYDVANTIVDLTDPPNSLIVTKVRGGHNCWLADPNACGDIIQSYVENWAGSSIGGGGREIQLVAPPLVDPGTSKNWPADSSLFASSVYPLVRLYCAGCHADTASIPQSPYFASADVDTAYEAARSRMDLDNPSNSRFVLRLRQEFHNCWDNCAANASEMEARITDLSNAIAPTAIDPDLVTSKAMRLVDGIVASSGGRHDNNVIALYEFKTGSGNATFDTSGVEPALNLTLSGDYRWVGGWGIQLIDGKARGTSGASAKLRNLITATGEFSVEAWVAPANVTQDGPARIVTYAGDNANRNFMLGQTLFNYDTFVRSSECDAGGGPQLSTRDADEVLQATLQHVVLTYDPANGRRIWVNGELESDADTLDGGLLNEWDDTFALVLGSEVDDEDRWAGTIRLLAIHNRALNSDQIRQNFEVGVGERYFVLFNVTDHVGIDDAYVAFQVSQYDSYGYLFDEPFFVILDQQVAPGAIPIAGLRIGANGREFAVGQAYRNLDVTIEDANYAAEGRQIMSTLGTVVPLEKGPTLDEFFLTFEVLGAATHPVVEPSPIPSPAPPDLPRDDPVGVRDFAEVHATMAKLTGIPASDPDVIDTYNAVRQAMPVQTRLGGFISSQQMGITQLAIEYCNVLVSDGTRRSAFWPDFNWTAPLATAFADRTDVTGPLYARMVGIGLETQPDATALDGQVNDLIDRLTACGGACEPDRVERVMKGACAAVLGSAVMLVQ
jgi:hypothetical protein